MYRVVDPQHRLDGAVFPPFVIVAGERLEEHARDRREKKTREFDEPAKVYVRVSMFLRLADPVGENEDRADREEADGLDQERPLEPRYEAARPGEEHPKVEAREREDAGDRGEHGR